jgi:Uma2 family endonuclease
MSILTAPLSVPPSRQPPPFPIHRLSVDDYHQMIQAGILTEADRVELLEGWIVPKMARNPPHDTALGLVQDVLTALLPVGWLPRVQSAITLADSEPEPDFAVVRGQRRDYKSRHPQPPDVGLLVEVADSTLQEDRIDKGRVYARAGIAIYWIVNLVDQQVEVYTDPDLTGTPPRYRQRQDYPRGSQAPLILDGQIVAQVAVDEFLP